MSIAKWAWKPRDVERAINVVRKAGLSVAGVKITSTGDIDIATGAPVTDDTDPWKQTVADLENDSPNPSTKPSKR